MNTFADVFERKEVKYRISRRQYRMLRAAFGERMQEDSFGRSLVTSRYFDTEERSLIARSLEKPLYKEKLRVRTYGTDADRAFVELKKKFKGIVYKRRIAMTPRSAERFLGGLPYDEALACARGDESARDIEPTIRSTQIAHEIEAFMDRWDALTPSMDIAVDRIALASAETDEEPAVRITFDRSVFYRDPRMLDAGWTELLNPGEAIMEIKVIGSYPLWLVRALDAVEAYPTSFSKYGEAYRRIKGMGAEGRLPSNAPAA